MRWPKPAEMNTFRFFPILLTFSPLLAYELYDSLAMNILPQLLCTQNGECSTVSFIPEEPEVTTVWDNSYHESIATPVYEDPWYQLVANRFHAIPPLPYEMQTVTPVTNIVRLPDRQAIRPYRHRPVDPPQFPVSLTSKIDAVTPPAAQNSPLTHSPTHVTVSIPNSHVTIFKLLLLIAFVAVPIVASTLPIIMPPNQMGRARRDDAVVNWATHSATLIALAHLASDDRLPELLKLHDEAFVEALSDAILTPLENDIDNRRTKQRISDSVLKLIQIVKSWDNFGTEENEETDEEEETVPDKTTDSEPDNYSAIVNGKKLIDFFIRHRSK